MRSVLAYTTARLLLFIAATGLLYLAGARGLLLLGLALLVSGIASYVILSRQRDRMSGALSARLAGARGRIDEFRGRLDAGSRAEDDDEGEPAPVPDGEHPA
jgi:Protein of unknown function (DUF4229)